MCNMNWVSFMQGDIDIHAVINATNEGATT